MESQWCHLANMTKTSVYIGSHNTQAFQHVYFFISFIHKDLVYHTDPLKIFTKSEVPVSMYY